MKIRMAGTVNDSIVDGPGLRLTLFVQGCTHGCPGCQNPHTHPLSGGTLMEEDELLQMALGNPLLDGVTFSGGEPFLQAAALARLGREYRRHGLNIITYTGYTLEELLENATEENAFRELLEATNVLVDGRFKMDQKSLDLKFRGSANQRVLRVRESLEQGEPVWADWAVSQND